MSRRVPCRLLSNQAAAAAPTASRTMTTSQTEGVPAEHSELWEGARNIGGVNYMLVIRFDMLVIRSFFVHAGDPFFFCTHSKTTKIVTKLVTNTKVSNLLLR